MFLSEEIHRFDDDLFDDEFLIETDLTDEEYDIIEKGRTAYRSNPSSYVPLSEIN